MNDIIDNVQAFAREAREFTKTTEARTAENRLREIHPALPSIVERSAEILEQVGIKTGDSRSTSRRLADAAVGEIIRVGGGKIDNTMHLEMTKHTLRSVLVQEAAGHELAGRTGRDEVRGFEREPQNGHGELAMKALEKSRVDVTRIFGQLDDADLRRASSGSYDRLSNEGRTLVGDALGRDNADRMSHAQIEMNRSISPAAHEERGPHAGLPIMIPARRLHRAPAAPARQATFGRRVAAVHAMASGVQM